MERIRLAGTITPPFHLASLWTVAAIRSPTRAFLDPSADFAAAAGASPNTIVDSAS